MSVSPPHVAANTGVLDAICAPELSLILDCDSATPLLIGEGGSQAASGSSSSRHGVQGLHGAWSYKPQPDMTPMEILEQYHCYSSREVADGLMLGPGTGYFERAEFYGDPAMDVSMGLQQLARLEQQAEQVQQELQALIGSCDDISPR